MPYGKLAYDDILDLVICEYCGKGFKTLAKHLKSHGVTAAEYKEKFGLLRRSALSAYSTREKQSAIQKKNNNIAGTNEKRRLGILKNPFQKGENHYQKYKRRQEHKDIMRKVAVEKNLAKYGREFKYMLKKRKELQIENEKREKLREEAISSLPKKTNKE